VIEKQRIVKVLALFNTPQHPEKYPWIKNTKILLSLPPQIFPVFTIIKLQFCFFYARPSTNALKCPVTWF
jgi:hypothetical protein